MSPKTGTTHPQVFISYSHETPEHVASALEVANRLRQNGINAIIDQYFRCPAERWPLWSEEQILQADYVLVVCTREYYRRTRHKGKPESCGVVWEYDHIRNDLYETKRNTKYIPIFIGRVEPSHVPHGLRGSTYYAINDEPITRCSVASSPINPTSSLPRSMREHPCWPNLLRVTAGNPIRKRRPR